MFLLTAMSCNKMPNIQNLGPGIHFWNNAHHLCHYTGLPVEGTFSNVMIDVGMCSENCQGKCFPTKTRKEIVHLYSGPKEVEIIDSCECLLNNGSSCATVKKEVTYFQGTSSQTTVNVNQCAGTCGGMFIYIWLETQWLDLCIFLATGISCLPIKEKSVAIDAGKNGITTATVIEECQCTSECYRKSYYEKVTQITNEIKEVVMHYLTYTYKVAICYSFSIGYRCRCVHGTLFFN